MNEDKLDTFFFDLVDQLIHSVSKYRDAVDQTGSLLSGMQKAQSQCDTLKVNVGFQQDQAMANNSTDGYCHYTRFSGPVVNPHISSDLFGGVDHMRSLFVVQIDTQEARFRELRRLEKEMNCRCDQIASLNHQWTEFVDKYLAEVSRTEAAGLVKAWFEPTIWRPSLSDFYDHMSQLVLIIKADWKERHRILSDVLFDLSAGIEWEHVLEDWRSLRANLGIPAFLQSWLSSIQAILLVRNSARSRTTLA